MKYRSTESLVHQRGYIADWVGPDKHPACTSWKVSPPLSVRCTRTAAPMWTHQLVQISYSFYSIKRIGGGIQCCDWLVFGFRGVRENTTAGGFMGETFPLSHFFWLSSFLFCLFTNLKWSICLWRLSLIMLHPRVEHLAADSIVFWRCFAISQRGAITCLVLASGVKLHSF